MKRTNTMRVMIGMLCVTALMSATAFAATGTPKVDGPVSEQQQQKQKEAGAYMTVDGTISLTEDRGEYQWIQVDNESGGIVFTASKDVFVLNDKTGEYMKLGDLKTGMKITAIVAKNAPQTLSLPPQTPGAIGFVVRSGEASVTADVFNAELIDQANDLLLHISQDTKIVHRNGTKKAYTVEDLKGSESVVLYTITTRSIPAQTTPHFVMILNTAEELAAQDKSVAAGTEAQDEVKASDAEKNVSYGELRTAAEAKGYKVEWTSNAKPIVLTKNDIKAEITIGSDGFTFTHNTRDIKALDRLEKMAMPAKLEAGKVMVSNDFLDALE